MVSHHSRRIAASRLRWLHQCRLAKWRLGNLCSQIGPAATSRLSGASVEFVKCWRKKILNPNFHSGKQMKAPGSIAASYCVGGVLINEAPIFFSAHPVPDVTLA